MAVEWTDDKIIALSDQDLKNLLANAERKSVADIAERCKAEIDRRNLTNPRKMSKQRSELKEFEHDVSGQIAEVGKEMAAKYDLSEETAKAKSEGVKGFRAHRLLDSRGFAKLGGHQRNGAVAVDRYISYRRGNDVVMLGVWLPKETPIDAREFHVIAPPGMIEGGRPFSEVRQGFEGTELQPGRVIAAFSDLSSAAVAFDKALAKITA